MIKLINSFLNLTPPSKQTLLLALAAIVPLGVIAYASIPASNGVISGCYKKSGGTLRVIDTAQEQCDPRNEMALTWNQTGPAGSQGPQGLPGPVGPAGPPGPSGSSGRLITVATADSFSFELMSSCSDAIRSKEFIKQSDSSDLRITYYDSALVNLNYIGGLSVDVLIDGSPTTPTPTDYVVQNGSGFTAFGYAKSIPAGTHTLTSRYNFGSFTPPSTCFQTAHYTIEIEEIQP